MKRRAMVWMVLGPWMVLALALGEAGAVGAAGWVQYEDPGEAGWSASGLEEARALAKAAGSTAVMVVEDGVAVAAWGAIDEPLPLYSMRKGLYNALVGMLVAEGKLSLDATVGELGIDEAEPLGEAERSATVEDLLTARSGVYRVSAYEPASMKRSRPARGSARPGERWFYNNWDFNVLAHLVEERSGHELAELFDRRLARPLGMEDFSPAHVFSFLEPSRSRYPAVIFRLSARDLARFGQLYLQEGAWDGEALLDPAWIAASWTPRTTFEAGAPFGAGNGFGYLWWIYPSRPEGEGGFEGSQGYVTRGSGGQVLAVFPERDLVVVHLTVSGEGSFEGAVRVVDRILAAQPRPEVTALDPLPLGEPPTLPEPRAVGAWSREQLDRLTGEYALGPEVSFLVHEVDGRLFALLHGVPLAEVELFVDATGTIFSPAVDVALEIVSDRAGRVLALEGRVERRAVRLERSGTEEVAGEKDRPKP